MWSQGEKCIRSRVPFAKCGVVFPAQSAKVGIINVQRWSKQVLQPQHEVILSGASRHCWLVGSQSSFARDLELLGH